MNILYTRQVQSQYRKVCNNDLWWSWTVIGSYIPTPPRATTRRHSEGSHRQSRTLDSAPLDYIPSLSTVQSFSERVNRIWLSLFMPYLLNAVITRQSPFLNFLLCRSESTGIAHRSPRSLQCQIRLGRTHTHTHRQTNYRNASLHYAPPRVIDCDRKWTMCNAAEVQMKEECLLKVTWWKHCSVYCDPCYIIYVSRLVARPGFGQDQFFFLTTNLQQTSYFWT